MLSSLFASGGRRGRYPAYAEASRYDQKGDPRCAAISEMVLVRSAIKLGSPAEFGPLLRHSGEDTALARHQNSKGPCNPRSCSMLTITLAFFMNVSPSHCTIESLARWSSALVIFARKLDILPAA
jgi:hypothetical protein